MDVALAAPVPKTRWYPPEPGATGGLKILLAARLTKRLGPPGQKGALYQVKARSRCLTPMRRRTSWLKPNFWSPGIGQGGPAPGPAGLWLA